MKQQFIAFIIAANRYENNIAVVNNSFGAHICSYLNVDTIAIYGGQDTVQEWASIWGENKIIYSDVSCSPCHLPEAKDSPYDLVCLKQIKPEMVLKEIYKKLGLVFNPKKVRLKNIIK